MKKQALRIVALSTTALLPLTAAAQDGGFDISDEPVATPEVIYNNFIEAGIGYNTADEFRAGRFTGLVDSEPFAIGAFGYMRRGPWDGDELFYVEAEGDRLGLENRSLGLEVGSQGLYRFGLEFEQIPFYDFEGLTPYQGVGSGRLGLPAGWAVSPAANPPTKDWPLLTPSLREVDIKTERTRYGTGLTWHFAPEWSARVAVRREDKDGLRPIGVSWGTNGGNPLAVVVPEPVDYTTDRVEAGIDYVSRRLQVGVSYELSLFNNDLDSLTVQNPFIDNPRGWAGGVNAAQMALPPDNTAHSVRLAGGYDLTESTRLTTNLAYQQYLQDQTFLPYSTNPALIAQGLPRNSLDGKIVTLMGDIGIYSRLRKDLDVRARYRYTDRDNQTPIDQFIYVAGDAENQNVAAASGRRRFNHPYSYTEHLVDADLGYQIRPETKLTLGYEFKDFSRTHSERSENVENTGKVTLRNRFGGGFTGTAKYARSWRDGSTYDGSAVLHDTFTQAHIATLAPATFYNHPLLRKSFEADRIRDKASLGMSFAPTAVLTFGATVGYVHDDYDETVVGLTGVENWNGTVEAAYDVNENLALSGFYTYENRTAEQAGWSFTARGVANKLQTSTDPTRRWWVDSEDRVHTAGATATWSVMENLRLSADYVFTQSRSEISTRAGTSLQPTGDFPDVVTRIHSIGIRGEYDLTEQITFGLGYAFERFSSDDWQVDSVPAVNTIDRVLTMGQDSPDYNAHLIMASTRFKF